MNLLGGASHAHAHFVRTKTIRWLLFKQHTRQASDSVMLKRGGFSFVHEVTEVFVPLSGIHQY